MDRIGIIADDLTGANDTGAQFSRRGWATSVAWGDAPAAGGEESDVRALDTGGRSREVATARERAAAAARALRDAGYTRLYKKVDSTLRGHVAAEIAAVMEASGARGCLLAPSYPANGRIVQRGRLYVRGVPLEETEAAADPSFPMTESLVPLLVAGVGIPVRLVELETVRAGANPLREALETILVEGRAIVVLDAETDQDLAAIAQVGCVLWRSTILAGSAGLAQAVAAALGGGARPLPARTAVRASLALIGSLNRISHAQVQRVGVEPEVDCALTDPTAWPAGGPAERDLAELAGWACAALAAGHDALLYVDRDAYEAAERRPSAERTAMVARALGALARRILDGAGPAPLGLVLSGGGTAMAALAALGVTGLSLGREIAPGIPWALPAGAGPLPAIVVTKAGGFGVPTTLATILRALRTPERPERPPTLRFIQVAR
jgi:uncharacterized protein YgbK (DUF1537 family)